MEWVETTGSSLEEATERALEALGVAVEDAEIEVVSDVKMGLFGRVRSEARIRARVRPALPRARSERRQGRRRQRDGRSPEPDSRPSRKDAAPTGPGEGREDSQVRAADEVEQPKSQSVSRKAIQEPEKGTTMAVEQDSSVQEHADLDEAADFVRRFLEGLLDHLELEGAVEVEMTESGSLMASVSGEGLGLLVGPRGATLNAVQDLTRAALPRSEQGPGPRLTVDIGDYLARRSQALGEFARKLADEVLESGNEKHLEPMSAADRKTVHDAINDVEGVTTRSEGEDPTRHVVIVRSNS